MSKGDRIHDEVKNAKDAYEGDASSSTSIDVMLKIETAIQDEEIDVETASSIAKSTKEMRDTLRENISLQ